MADGDYKHTGRASRGTVLIVAMWIVLVLAGLVLVFARAVRVETTASANRVARLQAEAVARGGLRYVEAKLAGTNGAAIDEGVRCEAVPVGEGFFWSLAADPEDERTHAFGIRDEASRLNLNTATQEMLLDLPGMTSELAAAIVDWRDPDGEVSPGGAESEYYLLLDEPYLCKNAPFETVEELLRVKGASLELLFGEDANRNGVLDPNENDGSDTGPPDNGDGNLDRGLFDYLTVYSAEPNLDADGRERINVNDVRAEGLSELLREVLADDRFFQVMERVRGGRPFENVLEFRFKTGLTPDEFAPVADQITTTDDETLRGLVNVNTAPRAVLLCLRGLEEGDVDALLAHRGAEDADLDTVAWVGEVLPREKAVRVGGLITTRSFQYCADIVAASAVGRSYCRYRAVIDASTDAPRVMFWHECTHLGWPLDSEVLAQLRTGDVQTNPGGVTSAGAW